MSSFVIGLGLHGGDAGEDGEDLVVPGYGDGAVEEEFVHCERDEEFDCEDRKKEERLRGE